MQAKRPTTVKSWGVWLTHSSAFIKWIANLVDCGLRTKLIKINELTRGS